MSLPTCQEIQEFLADYIQNELAPESREEFEKHLKGCPCCINYLKSYRTTVELLHNVQPPPSALPPLPVEMKQAILAARRRAASGDQSAVGNG